MSQAKTTRQNARPGLSQRPNLIPCITIPSALAVGRSPANRTASTALRHIPHEPTGRYAAVWWRLLLSASLKKRQEEEAASLKNDLGTLGSELRSIQPKPSSYSSENAIWVLGQFRTVRNSDNYAHILPVRIHGFNRQATNNAQSRGRANSPIFRC
jgi:hypothetical protein